jgi:hypothetical protein
VRERKVRERKVRERKVRERKVRERKVRERKVRERKSDEGNLETGSRCEYHVIVIVASSAFLFDRQCHCLSVCPSVFLFELVQRYY